MKRVITIALLGTTTTLMAMNAEYASLYKDPRVMGMGGASVAVGGRPSSVFSNPAGLASMKKEKGFIVDILNPTLSASKDFKDFYDDYDDAEGDAEKTALLNQYSGEHFHLGINNYMSLSKNSDSFAWTVGALTAADVNLMVHGNGSATGGFLETTSRGYAGVVLGIAKPLPTAYGRVDIGVSLKVISQYSYEGMLGINELVEHDGEDLEDTIQDKYEKKATGVAMDLGVVYHPFEESFWKPTVGVSMLNVGSLHLENQYGAQPMTVNVGVSISPELAYIDDLTVAADYMDIFHANKLRIYTNSPDESEVTYTESYDESIAKHIRVGASLSLVDNSWISVRMSGGVYQSEWTAGADIKLGVLSLHASSYAEEIGITDYETTDRRYMLQVGFGW